jgi:hypothetical protein
MVEAIIGTVFVGAGVAVLGALFQLMRSYPRIRTELLQVQVRDGRLAPDECRAHTGILRSGPITRRTRAGELEVLTAHVLSDDALMY